MVEVVALTSLTLTEKQNGSQATFRLSNAELRIDMIEIFHANVQQADGAGDCEARPYDTVVR